MSANNNNDSLLEMFLFETTQLIEQLEECVLISEKEGGYTTAPINEIFRIMHTIKGSAAMMMFEDISVLAHRLEDLFFYLREENPQHVDCTEVSDLILEVADFIKDETSKIQDGVAADGDSTVLQEKISLFLGNLKEENGQIIKPTKEKEGKEINPESDGREGENPYAYKATLFFEEGCGMENIRAYAVINRLKEEFQDLAHIPKDIMDSDESAQTIIKDGFIITFNTEKTQEEIASLLEETIFLRDMELLKIEEETKKEPEEQVTPVATEKKPEIENINKKKKAQQNHNQQSIISVNVSKLDNLMDLVGEMVIAEAMVLQNPDLIGLELENFRKAAGQLSKITSEIQDTVMSIRMVSLSITFNKMHRIVRDMCKKLAKDVTLEIIGEDTEVDKNVIEHISDPLMHLVRNAVDHGIEDANERKLTGKPLQSVVTLEARNTGSDVLIIVRDDGKGLDRDYILDKAPRLPGSYYRPKEEITDREVFGMLLMPGFSTNKDVTEFSGRGVGLDVVARNIESIGGSLSIESEKGKGTAFICKIPLTMAIIDGINVRVGKSCYTIPTMSVKEFFRINKEEVIIDPDGNEMIMIRGKCYQIQRLHELYNIETDVTDFSEGILVMIEHEEKEICIFVDELIGQQQVVVKTLPNYIRKYKQTRWLSGCTLLGDGSISLILDIARMQD